MNLSQLYYFVMTCDCDCNMSRAAERLTISQTAISHAVRSLESEFHLQLFYRDKKQLRLTPGGKDFLFYARNVVEATTELSNHFHRGESRRNRSLSVGMTPLAQGVLSGALSKVGLSVPVDVKGHYVFQIDTLFNLLDQAVLDIVIIGTSTLDSYDNYDKQVLGDCRTSLYTSQHNPLAKQHKVRVEQLENEPILCYLEDVSMLGDFTRIVAKFLPGLSLSNIKGSTTEMASLVEFIRRTDGSTLIAHGAIGNVEGICEVPIEGALPFQIAAFWRKNMQPSNPANEFLRHMEGYLESMA